MKADNFNRLTLKALLIDTITFLKFGQHIAPNWKSAKNELCTLLGQKNNISANQLLHGIGLVYRDNKIEAEFWQVIDKYNAQQFLN
jgi:hypothetical protein